MEQNRWSRIRPTYLWKFYFDKDEKVIPWRKNRFSTMMLEQLTINERKKDERKEGKEGEWEEEREGEVKRKEKKRPSIHTSHHIQKLIGMDHSPMRCQNNSIRKLFCRWCWDNWIFTCKRMELGPFLTPYTEVNSKWIDLKRMVKTIKLLRRKHRIKPLWLRVMWCCFRYYSKSTSEKKKKINWT